MNLMTLSSEGKIAYLIKQNWNCLIFLEKNTLLLMKKSV